MRIRNLVSLFGGDTSIVAESNAGQVVRSFAHTVKYGIAAAFVGALTVGCGAAPGEDVSAETERIEGGQVDHVYTGVGYTSGSGTCSAALITPSLAVTAAHCGTMSNYALGENVQGNNADENHRIDAQVSMPFTDLKLVHLSWPASNAQILSVNGGDYPATGTNCTAVGYGRHHTDKVNYYNGERRSATVAITTGTQSANDPRIYARWVDGGTNHGDSGGPLLCDGKIAGVLSSGPEGWPYNTTTSKFSYTPVYPQWILENIGLAPVPLTGSLVATNGSALYRVAQTVGNRENITASGADWSGAQSMVTLNGTVYSLQSGYLTTIDPQTGAFNLIGNQDWGGTAYLAVLNGVLYGYHEYGIWRFTDLTTGTYERVGGIDWTGVTAMGAVDSTSHLFVIKNSQLYYVTTGGSALQLGTGGSWGGLSSMATIGDTLYIAHGNRIYKLSGTGLSRTGGYAPVGSADWTGATSLTALNGQLYLVQNGHLHRVDPTTGDYRVLDKKIWDGTVVMAAIP